LRRERARAANIVHGLRGHELYPTWSNMLGRCENPNAISYRYYGARGIKVCRRWHSFPAFLNDILREIGRRPRGKTLDRIHNSGHYRPGNMRWATARQQARNRPNTGHRQTPEAIAKMLATRRLRQRQWSEAA
jgi:hypothetical protein